MRAAAVAKTTNYVWCLFEHPEGLGAMPNGSGVPASIWQLDKISNLSASPDMKTFAIWQCFFGPDYPKPTRLLSDIASLSAAGYPGWPHFSQHDAYLGPLPKACGHMHRHRLVRKPGDAGFKTTGTAAYPDAMNYFLAQAAHSFSWNSARPIILTLAMGAWWAK